MNNLPFGQVHYSGSLSAVNWVGVELQDCQELTIFMTDSVGGRVFDRAEHDDYVEHLEGLALTGMGRTALAAVLGAETPEERDWAVGESLAEALLVESYGVIFPWNTERDKRNPRASLPGADIVGFLPEGSGFRLAFGEVKSSTQEMWPPGVVNGRHGLGHQLDGLATDLNQIGQLLKWLYPRVKGTEFQAKYESAVTIYFDSGNKSAALYGILIRDTSPNEADLKGRGGTLGSRLVSPTSCHLIGVYLPHPIAELPNRVGAP